LQTHIAATTKYFVVRADEKLTAFLELAAYRASPYITIRRRLT
jgi:hypothetical protein